MSTPPPVPARGPRTRRGHGHRALAEAAMRRRHSERRTCRLGRRPAAVPLPDGFAPYAWAATVAEVAARHGLAPAQVLKFDQNTPPLPGVAADPARGELRDPQRRTPTGPTASCARRRPRYVSRDGGAASAGSRSSSARARTISSCSAPAPSSAPGRTASIVPPTYALYRIATMLDGRGSRRRRGGADGASLIWRCNPDNPTGVVTPAAELVELARRHPERGGRRRRGLRRVRRRDRRPVARRVPEPDRAAHDVEGVRLRRAPRRLRGRSTRDGRGARRAARAGADLRARCPHRRRGAPRPALRPRARDSPSASASATRSSRPGSTRRRPRATSSGSAARTISARGSSSRASSCAASRRGSG